LCALPAFASGATGTWTCQVKDADANAVTLTFIFKQDGTKLTGSHNIRDENSRILDNTSIRDGKVDERMSEIA
jgi:hypothetical protein